MKEIICCTHITRHLEKGKMTQKLWAFHKYPTNFRQYPPKSSITQYFCWCTRLHSCIFEVKPKLSGYPKPITSTNTFGCSLTISLCKINLDLLSALYLLIHKNWHFSKLRPYHVTLSLYSYFLNTGFWQLSLVQIFITIYLSYVLALNILKKTIMR